MRAFRYFPRFLVVSLLYAFLPYQAAQAQQASETALTDLVAAAGAQYTPLEVLAARGAQATFNRLLQDQTCGLNQTVVDTQGFPDCTADVLRVFSNLRELVETANEILGNQGPTRFSLGLDVQGVGFALRWVTAEELLAPESISSQFAQAQVASLFSRITALRFGASGFTMAGMPMRSRDRRVARRDGALGGGASADDIGIASRWGGFLDGSFNWGDRAPSGLEDAFDYDNQDVSLGLDYRVNAQSVIGLMFGHTSGRVEFDSTRSVVSGGIRSKGWGLTLYGLQEWDGPFVSAALGYQSVRISTRRDINYPSFNPDVEAVYATATGSTDSGSLTATLDFGWPYRNGGFSLEPYGRAEFRQMKIDGFSEASISNSGSNAGQPAGFDFSVGDQSTNATSFIAGARLQQVFTPSFGVFVPYLRAEYHRSLSSREGRVDTVYNAIADSDIGVAIPGDKRDTAYTTLSLGASAVLPHGWQLFGQAQKVFGLNYVRSYTLAGGIRAEF